MLDEEGNADIAYRNTADLFSHSSFLGLVPQAFRNPDLSQPGSDLSLEEVGLAFGESYQLDVENPSHMPIQGEDALLTSADRGIDGKGNGNRELWPSPSGCRGW